jgi:hypothetical protein
LELEFGLDLLGCGEAELTEHRQHATFRSCFWQNSTCIKVRIHFPRARFLTVSLRIRGGVVLPLLVLPCPSQLSKVSRKQWPDGRRSVGDKCSCVRNFFSVASPKQGTFYGFLPSVLPHPSIDNPTDRFRSSPCGQLWKAN